MPLISQDPAEGSRAIVERELKRKQHQQAQLKKAQKPLAVEKDDRGTETARRRAFDANGKISQPR
jgi:hypothetical protein